MTCRSRLPRAKLGQDTGLDEVEVRAYRKGPVDGSSSRLILADYPSRPFARPSVRRQRRSFAIADQQGRRHMPRGRLDRLTLAICPMVAAERQCTISRRASHSSSETKTPSRMAAAARKRSRGRVARPSRLSCAIHGRVVFIAGILFCSDYGNGKTIEPRSAGQLNVKMLEFGHKTYAPHSALPFVHEMLT